jgi:hypothetical protein
MHAVLAWLQEGQARAAQQRLRLVILMQANPFVPRTGYQSLNARLAELAAAAPGRVVLVHGDTHLYRDDEPLAGLRRVEVWGAPWVSWLRGRLSASELLIEQAGQY